ncbi:pyruvate oxidase [Loigolactobacillus backii]|nr:pyruvate oxidase [Loigolactobacillus backii]MDA5387539.1 pyruvate oxidase [Loigolactobacillus backii]MDA5390097.1 pyruvate oxidase [Loigolactobacillus backii]
MPKIKAANAMLNVLKDWKVDHLYGLPGGSFDSTMNALHETSELNYIQVRHEETGALAAAADAKLTGKIGVAFGSAGPGATHLFNGLYDAKMDHVPVLALVGQVATSTMNTDGFQELNENPMFNDVAVYNRTVTTAQQLPHVVDQAIKHAYQESSVAVVTIPTDLGWIEIEDSFTATAKNYRQGYPQAEVADINAAVKLLTAAKRPTLYIGQGTRGATDEVVALADYYSMPIVSSVLAKGIIPDDHPAYMGTAGRVASKPGNEIVATADLILFIGSDFPFAASTFNLQAKFIQIDIDSSKLGKRHHTDVAILGDAKTTMRQLFEQGQPKEKNSFYQAALANNKNWRNWLASFATAKQIPLRVEPIFAEINRIAQEDAIFAVDVGNVTIDGIRLLSLTPNQKFTTSGWFATMGYGLPAAIAAQLNYKKRQVFNIAGDGGFSMGMQDLITAVKYKLPIINVVLSNDSLGFIEAEQDDTPQPHSGIDLASADYATFAKAMGAEGYSVHNLTDLRAAFDQAASATGPIVIDVKIANERPIPVEHLVIDPEAGHSQTDIDQFNQTYASKALVPFQKYLTQYQA